MKQVIIIVLLATLHFSCDNNKKEKYLILGKWMYTNNNKGSEIKFFNGLYSQIKWNDDLVYRSNGKYYLNENINRSVVTITLIPDLQYIEGDTILLPCENIDILNLTDTVMIIKKPTQWHYRDSNQRVANSEIIKFIKSNDLN